MSIALETVEQLVPVYMYPGLRISGLITTMPLIGTRMVPSRIKLVLVVAITMVVAPMVEPPEVDIISLNGFLVGINQILIGIIIGVILQIIIQLFLMVGQLVSQQMGLGFAMMNDPSNGVNVPVMGQFYMMMALFLFVTVNGHLLAIQALVMSFQTIPVGLHFVSFPSGAELIYWGGWLFINSLQIALPAITALFLVNMSFGIMTKAAPQLNIFSIGFPVTMIVGIVVLWLAMSTILPGFELIFEQVFDLVHTLLGVGDG